MLLLLSSDVPPLLGLFIKRQGLGKCGSFSAEIRGLGARLTNTFSPFMSFLWSSGCHMVRRGHAVTGNTRGHSDW